MEIINKIFFIYFLLTNFLTGEEKIRYFLDYSSPSSNKVCNTLNIFQLEIDNTLNSINGFNEIQWMNTLKSKKLLGYYKVYYKYSKPIKVEEVNVSGYYYKNGKIHQDKNSTKLNLGIIAKFDDYGRTVYSYNIKTSEMCKIFYGIEYNEKNCSLNGELKKVKKYYESNQLKISIKYIFEEIVEFSKVKIELDGTRIVLDYDGSGRAIDIYLNHLKTIYENSYSLTQKSKEEFQKLINKQENKLKNIPDLNLTLEKQYFDKIDRLNGR